MHNLPFFRCFSKQSTQPKQHQSFFVSSKIRTLTSMAAATPLSSVNLASASLRLSLHSSTNLCACNQHGEGISDLGQQRLHQADQTAYGDTGQTKPEDLACWQWLQASEL